MANEFRGVASTGETCYAILENRSGEFWNGTAFETFAGGNYADYDISTPEVGSTGIYEGDFPTAITASGSYPYVIKRQQGGSPAQDDPIAATGTVDWTGSSSSIASTGSMDGSDWLDYVLRGGFKRTDKDTEVYEETTDAIQEMRRAFMFDEAEVETTTTDTISVLGDFKLDVESDFGLILGILLEDGQNGTPLIYKTKNQFDKLYPDINVTNDKGYPLHFTIYAGQIQIGPIPDRVSYSYRISYSQRAGTVTSGTTSVPFTRDYRDILRDLVLSKLYKLMEEFDKSAQFRQYYSLGFEDAKIRERKNSGIGNFNVKPFGM